LSELDKIVNSYLDTEEKKAQPRQISHTLFELLVANQKMFEWLNYLVDPKLALSEELYNDDINLSFIKENFIPENIFFKEHPENGYHFVLASMLRAYYRFCISLNAYGEESLVLSEDLRQAYEKLRSLDWSLKISRDQLIEGGLFPLTIYLNIQFYNENDDIITHGYLASKDSVKQAYIETINRIQNMKNVWNKYLDALQPFIEQILNLPFYRNEYSNQVLTDYHEALRSLLYNAKLS
jgi:hypothetical protein